MGIYPTGYDYWKTMEPEVFRKENLPAFCDESCPDWKMGGDGECVHIEDCDRLEEPTDFDGKGEGE